MYVFIIPEVGPSDGRLDRAVSFVDRTLATIYNRGRPHASLGPSIPDRPALAAIRNQTGREDLQSDIPTELRVPRAVDLPHAAGAKRGQDLVRTEARPERKGQLSSGIIRAWRQ
jgi:hypothetical protein